MPDISYPALLYNEYLYIDSTTIYQPNEDLENVYLYWVSDPSIYSYVDIYYSTDNISFTKIDTYNLPTYSSSNYFSIQPFTKFRLTYPGSTVESFPIYFRISLAYRGGETPYVQNCTNYITIANPNYVESNVRIYDNNRYKTGTVYVYTTNKWTKAKKAYVYTNNKWN